ncbi:MAG TPA: hypothetical protein VFW33_17380, partial [Gemmataceae bacterium]|nr:hypothetical protein [Gemmataceae bacterium]
MTSATEIPLPHGKAAPEDVAATVAELRRQMAALDEQVAAVNRQQEAVRAALEQLLARFPELGQAAPSGSSTPPRQCADDVVRVLREVGRPLGPLEILEELAVRHLTWRESTVRHVLADLVNEGIVRGGQRPMSYSL